MAFLHYCDGGSFGTSNPNPVPITPKGNIKEIWFRGRAK